MTIADFIAIAAIFFGPIVAVRVSRYLDDQKEKRERKVNIFKTLMATRAYTVSWAHVEALNKIDLEFNESSEKEVFEAWKAYLDLLNTTNIPEDQWTTKRVDLLVDLLYKMACVLDYDFGKIDIKNSFYAPRAHGETEEEQDRLRKGIIEVLSGKRSINMSITNWPQENEQ